MSFCAVEASFAQGAFVVDKEPDRKETRASLVEQQVNKREGKIEASIGGWDKSICQ